MSILYFIIKPYIKLINEVFTINIPDLTTPLMMCLLLGYMVYIFIRCSDMPLKIKATNRVDLFLCLTALFLMLSVIIVNFFILDSGIILYSGWEQKSINIKDYLMSFIKGAGFQTILFVFLGMNFSLIKDYFKESRFVIIFYWIFSVTLLMSQIYLGKGDINSVLFRKPGVYLYLGDLFAMFSLLVVYTRETSTSRYIMMINSIYWLYKLGSRTSFILFLLIAAIDILKRILNYIKSGIDIRNIIKISALCLLVIIIIFSMNKDLKLFDIQNNKMISLFVDFENDYSVKGRNRLINEGFENIKENWFLGELFVGIKEARKVGEYIHNILSYWCEFGLIPFLAIVYLSIKNLIRVANKIVFTNYLYENLEVYITIYFLIACLISRSYVYPYLWLPIFLWIGKVNNLSES